MRPSIYEVAIWAHAEWPETDSLSRVLHIDDGQIIGGQAYNSWRKFALCLLPHATQQAQHDVFAMRLNQKTALGTNGRLLSLRRFDEEITKSDLDGWVNMKLGLLYGDQAVRIH